MHSHLHAPFSIRLGDSVPQDMKTIKRIGVRAILVKDNKLLMMKSNRGDYKFPGGGMEEGEDEVTALAREIREETGYTDFVIEDLAGTVVQAHPDIYLEDAWYYQTSPYYLVTLKTDASQPLELTEDEIDHGFHAVWTTPKEAIQANEAVPIDPFLNFYIERENRVLQVVQDHWMPKEATLHAND